MHSTLQNQWFAAIILLPLILASISFSNSQPAYTAQGAFCSLPTSPIWYRIALSYAPRYLIALIVVYLTPLFGARNVTVRGTKNVAEVVARARVPHGQPLARLDTGAIAARVETLPDVASARVTTSFPSGVVITVDERAAVGYVRIDGVARLVDRTGLEFREVHSSPSDIPRFVVPSGTGARSVGSAIATVAASLPASVRPKVDSIQALDPQAITLLLDHGVVVHWGSAARSADKARILPVLLDRPGDSYDVTDPDQPFAH